MEAAADPSTVKPAGRAGATRTIFLGSGSFAVPILDSLAGLPGISIVAVVSAPDRPVGRKAVVTPTPVTARARELGLPILQPVRVRRPEAIAEISALSPDLAILADYGQLIPQALLDLPPRGFLNLHPSALPRHRGAAPIPATILAGDRESAVSLMVVTPEMDAGPIVATAPLEVRPDDTAVTLEDRAATVAADLIRRALPDWLAGRLAPRPQPARGVTVTRPLRRDDGRLDPSRPADQLERQVRAYQPWPGSFLETPSGRLIVYAVSVLPVDSTHAPASDSAEQSSGSADEPAVGSAGQPGRLVRDRDCLALTTARGRLLLDEVQLAGKRRMSGAELLRGYPALADARAE